MIRHLMSNSMGTLNNYIAKKKINSIFMKAFAFMFHDSSKALTNYCPCQSKPAKNRLEIIVFRSEPYARTLELYMQ